MLQQAPQTAHSGQCVCLTDGEARGWAAIFKTLGDPVRLRLLMRLAALRGAEVPVHEICDVGVSLPTVSHHLKRLREAGLVQSRRSGRVVYYRVTTDRWVSLSKILHESDPLAPQLGESLGQQVGTAQVRAS